MPFSSLDWEGLKLFLDPISKTLNLKVNRSNIKQHLVKAADKIGLAIKNEMKGKLICLKTDSAARHGRNVLRINVQYGLSDVVVTRTLGKRKCCVFFFYFSLNYLDHFFQQRLK